MLSKPLFSKPMPQFRYTARNAEGKLVDGVIACDNRAAAIRQVEQQRFVPIKIEPVPEANGQASAAATAKAAPSKSPATSSSETTRPAGQVVAVETMSHSQQYLFTEQLAHLLGSGMTLDEALNVLVKRMKHPKLQGLSHGLHRALIDGRSLSQALRDYPKIFSPLYVNMVAAGEASGALSEILKRLVLHLGSIKSMRDRVQQALLYPALLVIAGIGLITVFMTVMVPQLMKFFTEANATLPTATRILLAAHGILVSYWWLMVLAIVGTVAGIRILIRTPKGRLAWDTLLWRLPLYSMIIRYRFYAQFARTLGTLVENGVTLLRALELLEEITGNEFVRLRMVAARRAVVDGATLSTAMGEQQLLPELFIDMMAVGEQTGRFGTTMQNIADVYERELDKQVQIISALVPPLVMLVIASLIGFVVYGILSAVFGMTNALRAGGR